MNRLVCVRTIFFNQRSLIQSALDHTFVILALLTQPDSQTKAIPNIVINRLGLLNCSLSTQFPKMCLSGTISQSRGWLGKSASISVVMIARWGWGNRKCY